LFLVQACRPFCALCPAMPWSKDIRAMERGSVPPPPPPPPPLSAAVGAPRAGDMRGFMPPPPPQLQPTVGIGGAAAPLPPTAMPPSDGYGVEVFAKREGICCLTDDPRAEEEVKVGQDGAVLVGLEELMRNRSRPLTSRSMDSCASSVRSMSGASFTKGSTASRTSRSSSAIRAWAQERAGRGPPPIPESLKCGICGEVFTDPVLTCDGAAYDRRCIEAWFAGGQRVSPKTRQELECLEVRANPALQAAVDDYLRLRDIADKEQKQWVEFVGELQGRMVRKLDQKNQQVHALRSALVATRRHQSIGGVPGQMAPPTPRQEKSGMRPSPSQPKLWDTPETRSVSGSTEEDKLSDPSDQPSVPSPVVPLAFAPGPAPRSTSASRRSSSTSGQMKTLLGRLKAGSWKGKTN